MLDFHCFTVEQEKLARSFFLTLQDSKRWARQILAQLLHIEDYPKQQKFVVPFFNIESSSIWRIE